MDLRWNLLPFGTGRLREGGIGLRERTGSCLSRHATSVAKAVVRNNSMEEKTTLRVMILNMTQ